ncbi:synaptosomal-associated protein 29-like [Glandiceps talaboti]
MASRSNNPFYEEDDYSFETASRRSDRREQNDDYTYFQQERMERERGMLESTQRSLGLVYESERMGVDTAEELVRQGEQLNRTETNLDKINKDMKTTQQHLTSLKSVFGGFINYFRSKPKEEEQAPEKTQSERLEKAVQQTQARDTSRDDVHPAMRLRDPYTTNYNASYNADYDDSQEGNGYQSSSRQVDRQLDKNLGEMSSGMNRLKDLALGLGDEIERQNDQIDRLNQKSDKADTSLFSANKEMNKILYK